jgi:hypothetical protein
MFINRRVVTLSAIVVLAALTRLMTITSKSSVFPRWAALRMVA